MSAITEKGGGTFQGIKLLLCENPLPPIDKAIAAALSKAHSLAGFRVGYGIFPEAMADDLNSRNDAYPLARPSQAAALGVRTYLTRTYFFLADFSPHNATFIAEQLRHRDIFIKPLNDPELGPGYMRITTALSEDNRRFVAMMREVLSCPK